MQKVIVLIPKKSFFSGTHCLEPPFPTGAQNALLYRDWDANPVNFTVDVPYRCERGRKFDIDFDKTEHNVTCLPGNEWDEHLDLTGGAYPICVESE